MEEEAQLQDKTWEMRWPTTTTSGHRNEDLHFGIKKVTKH